MGLYTESIAHLTSVNYEEALIPRNASNVGSVSTMLSVPISQLSAGSGSGGYTPSLAELDNSLKEGKIWRLTQLIRGKCLEGV